MRLRRSILWFNALRIPVAGVLSFCFTIVTITVHLAHNHDPLFGIGCSPHSHTDKHCVSLNRAECKSTECSLFSINKKQGICLSCHYLNQNKSDPVYIDTSITSKPVFFKSFLLIGFIEYHSIDIQSASPRSPPL